MNALVVWYCKTLQLFFVTIRFLSPFQCLSQYVSFEIMAGAYDISCPDSECEKQGVITIPEMEPFVGKDLVDKHKDFRLNTG